MSFLIGLFVVVAVLCQTERIVMADRFSDFVRAKMQNYSTWIENLDPSPPRNISKRISDSGVANLESTISQIVLQGHSKGETRIHSLSTDMSKKRFHVYIDFIANQSFSGLHATNGTILSTIPLSGTGRWSINISLTKMNWFEITFGIFPSGDLYIQSTQLESVRLPDTAGVYFQGITDSEAAQGYENYVELSLYNGFRNYLSDFLSDNSDPIRFMFLQYWEEVFAETTLADISDEPL